MGPGKPDGYSLKYLGKVPNDYKTVLLDGKEEKLKPDSGLWRDSGHFTFDIVESDEYWYMVRNKEVTGFIKKNDKTSKCPPLLTRFETPKKIGNRSIEMISCKGIPDDENEEDEDEEGGDYENSGDYDYSNWECPYGNCKSGKCISRSFQSKKKVIIIRSSQLKRNEVFNIIFEISEIKNLK